MRIFLTQPRSNAANFSSNLEWLRRTVEKSRVGFSSTDILLLPELFGGECRHAEYARLTSGLARELGCYVVAGSHHDQTKRQPINRGAVADPGGAIISKYEKLRPYGIETKLGIAPGRTIGRFDAAGCHVLVLVCADFWYSAVLLSRLSPRPDVILVPTFSVSRRASPHVARSLWNSMAVARAYEFGAYVGISDWAHPCEYHGLRSSSVAGLADPRAPASGGFFSRVGSRVIASYDIDLIRIRKLREDRTATTFLSDETLTGDFLNRTKKASSRARL
ncbi:MAG TPA: carbon-nitrogen hydrolase family protein [Candidatus Binataceae bacterium]|nr:carbon-nitrogen hydrolase family protein [Candidatus Binataceae bacterium]